MSWELKLPGPVFAVAYDDAPPREAAIALATDSERPSLVCEGARCEDASACEVTE